MIRTYTARHNLPALHDELLAANAVTTEAVVEGDGETVRLTLPDNADETAIATVVAAHDPDLADARRAKLAAIQAEAEDRKHRRIREAARTHADAVRALGTIAEIEAYDFSTGWPE